MLRRAASYDAAKAGFSWEIPERYNIGVDVCDRWAAAEPDRLAMVALDRTDGPVDVTYGELRALSNRLANALAARGVSGPARLAMTLCCGCRRAPRFWRKTARR